MNKKEIIVKLSKSIYEKEPVLKAAYIFSDLYYIYVDDDSDNYFVKLESKNNDENEINEKSFINEVISQTVRYNIMKQTKNIRELIMGRALATTMINDSEKYQNEEIDTDINCILVDWFDKYDIA